MNTQQIDQYDAGESGAGQSGAAQPGVNRNGITRVILIATSIVGGLALLATGVSTATTEILGSQVAIGGLSSIEFDDGFTPLDDFDDLGSDIRSELSTLDSNDTSAGLDGASSDESRVFTETFTAPAAELTSLSIAVDAAHLSIVFADTGETGEAQLETRGTGAAKWQMEATGGQLQISRAAGSRTTGCLFVCGEAQMNAAARLTLPKELLLTKLDTDITVNAGEVEGKGAFGKLQLSVNAGSAELSGTADYLDLDVNAGSADLAFMNTSTAKLAASAADAEVKLSGTQPQDVDVTLEVGSLAVELPKGEYLVESRGELGTVNNELTTSKTSEHRVSVKATMGEVDLHHID